MADRVTRAAVVLPGTLLAAGVVGFVVGSGVLAPLSLGVLALAAAGIVLFVVAGERTSGAFLAVALTGGAADALPGPSLGGLTNPAMFGLLVVLAYMGRRNFARVPKAIWLIAGLLAVWWFFETARALSLGAPLRPTIRFGQDFGIFSAAVPLYAAALMDPKFRAVFLLGISALAAWIAAVNIGASLGVLPSDGNFAHAYRSTPTGAINRLYALSSDVTTTVIPFALGAALLARRKVWRQGGVVLLALCLTEALLSLGRVKYAGIAVSLIIVLSLWGRGKALVRAGVLGGVLIATLALASAAGPLRAPVSALTERASTIFASSAERRAYEGADTLQYRDLYKKQIRADLSFSDWVAGRGFLPSPWYSFTPDATRSLRNSDLGWYGALNTMGLIGVTLLFSPLLVILNAARRRRDTAEESWLIFGAAGFALYAIAVSSTLVTMFSPSGLVLAALALGLGLAALTPAESFEPADPEARALPRTGRGSALTPA